MNIAAPKDGFKSIAIEPLEDYLEFMGPAQPASLSSTGSNIRVLRGEARFSLTKSVKIRSMTVKFKGFSRVQFITSGNPVEISMPLLPKLKRPLFGKTTLPAGDHVVSWDLEIPNIYPRTTDMKRASIDYKIELSISVNLHKTLTATYPIVIQRHLLPSCELAPLVETRVYKSTVPAKFHYEIDAPQIVCIDQGSVPIAIQYLCFASQKFVRSIRTQLIQIEYYRCQAIPKSECDMQAHGTKETDNQKMSDTIKNNKSYTKFVKRTVPALIHNVNAIKSSTWKRPLVISHPLHPQLVHALESPLVSIYHQLEVTFLFEHKYETVRAKIPLIVASVPKSSHSIPLLVENGVPWPRYHFETQPRYESVEFGPEMKSKRGEIDSMTSGIQASVFREDKALFLKPPPRQKPTFVEQSFSEMDLPSLNKPIVVERTLKKFASAFDLSTASRDDGDEESGEEAREIIERPRTTTPTSAMRREKLKKSLPPLDIELANTGKSRIQKGVKMEQLKSSGSSDVLPAADMRDLHNQVKQHYNSLGIREKSRPKLEVMAASSGPPLAKPDPPYGSLGRSKYYIANELFDDDEDETDNHSVVSEASYTSKNAPSLSSSATASSNPSRLTLLSRPPSPVFSPAPGLPATIPLQSHEETHFSLVEESFINSPPGAMSPAMATVASSTVLSPRTTYALRRRLVLSSVSSLVIDEAYASTSVTEDMRTSSILDPEGDTMCRIGIQQLDDACAVKNHYLNAKLPPLPTDTPNLPQNPRRAAPDMSKRLTKLYVDDSDEEDPEPLPAIPENLPPIDHFSRRREEKAKEEPPKLPRLSFGMALGVSLGLDFK
ncbi:hypothetical protein PHYBLDRAFT_141270 [Phycomyces blakesleeanus NRRL 1555(-)]|uniref:Arrestin C-terminal-like domain-containing protein n=1 Tax=Phycomyces blakesleeanus (strain ATCC 8743b / DSM 1359 / FGSC 10004 / NBRC 33097 / NRRL 1555) TaxID=763407 RepID=A0A167P771_PHYB8|nr:hypothetical protein PHYBLDRAFT_141270 [Phycomyces blakesleeanus NRRL 1555(-)]OAD77384.1 hypothetical protein PHYBLDRAFT_141270 [Phycomyces blakesleeanus NRRL 1555(-)]|eukprot:XP_018295424.1 hypothetical protein PHYBLDRAFT_141270 [Phycomyces blakesleeanus NRRL 1555(-)]